MLEIASGVKDLLQELSPRRQPSPLGASPALIPTESGQRPHAGDSKLLAECGRRSRMRSSSRLRALLHYCCRRSHFSIFA